MHRTVTALVTLLSLPALAAAEEGASPPAPEAVEVADALPATSLDVAYAEGGAEPRAGGTIEAGARVRLAAGQCLRLVAADRASVTLCGPAEAVAEAAGAGLTFAVSSGRGVLRAGPAGAAVRVSGRLVAVRSGAAAFEATPAPLAWSLEGEAMVDGAPAPAAPPEIASELGAATLCAPPRPRISIRLGDPGALRAESERTRAAEAEGGGEAATAEGGATCVDSSSGSGASDPGQGGELGPDPGARRDAGRVLVHVEIPRRAQ